MEKRKHRDLDSPPSLGVLTVTLDDSPPPAPRSRTYEMPVEIIQAIDARTEIANIKLHIMSMCADISDFERRRRLRELYDRRLRPDLLRDQVYEALHRGNTIKQLHSVVKFLFDMQNAIIDGEQVPHPDSCFARVPFS